MMAIATDVVPFRELFGTLFDALTEGVIVVDSTGQIVIANYKVEQMLGYEVVGLVGASIESLIPEESREMHAAQRTTFARTTVSRPMARGAQITARRLDGSCLPVTISLASCTVGDTPMVIATVREVKEESANPSVPDRVDAEEAIGEVVAFHHKLASIASLGQGVAGLAEAVRHVTGGMVLIEDFEGSLSFCTSDGVGVEVEGGEWRTLTGLRHAKAVRHGDWLVAVARPGGEILGAVSLYDPAGKADETASFALEEAASILAIELYRLRTVAESELKIWGDLASELLDDTNVERALRHAAALGIEIERMRRAVVFAPGNIEDRQLFAAVRRAARIVGFDATLMTSRGSDLILLVADEVDWVEFRRVLIHEVPFLGRIGIGDLHEPISLKDSVTEAQLALRIGSGDVVQIDQLGVLGFLAVDADPVRLRAMVDRWIGSLVTYDAIHGSTLVHTLAEFLRNNGAVEATARALYVHSSTLKYRLRRIRELSGRDLRNPDDRFNLELACRVHATLASLSAIAFTGTETDTQFDIA